MEAVKTLEDIHDSTESKSNLLFGELLVSKGILTRRQLIEALNEQRKEGGRLGEVLVRLKMLSDDQITGALAEHLSMESIRFDDMAKIDMSIARMLPETISKRFCLVAVGEIDDKVIIAMADPLNVVAIDTITLKLNRQIKVVVSSPEEIRRAIEAIYHGSDAAERRLRDLVELEVDAGEDEKVESILGEEDISEAESSGEADATKPPVIRFVDLLLNLRIRYHIINRLVQSLWVVTQRQRSMGLRIQVNQQNPFPQSGQCCRNIHRSRGLTATTFLICYRYGPHFLHYKLPQPHRFCANCPACFKQKKDKLMVTPWLTFPSPERTIANLSMKMTG